MLDASVAAVWCFADEATAASQALRRSLVDNIAVVPRLWHTETANMLLVAERRVRITAARCAELLGFLAAIPLKTEDEQQRIPGPVLGLARKHGLKVYDAIYLDLALREGLPLATRDKDLRKAALTAGRDVAGFASRELRHQFGLAPSPRQRLRYARAALCLFDLEKPIFLAGERMADQRCGSSRADILIVFTSDCLTDLRGFLCCQKLTP